MGASFVCLCYLYSDVIYFRDRKDANSLISILGLRTRAILALWFAENESDQLSMSLSDEYAIELLNQKILSPFGYYLQVQDQKSIANAILMAC